MFIRAVDHQQTARSEIRRVGRSCQGVFQCAGVLLSVNQNRPVCGDRKGLVQAQRAFRAVFGKRAHGSLNHAGQPGGIAGSHGKQGIHAHADLAVDHDIRCAGSISHTFNGRVGGSKAPGGVDQQHAPVEIHMRGAQRGAARGVGVRAQAQFPARGGQRRQRQAVHVGPRAVGQAYLYGVQRARVQGRLVEQHLFHRVCRADIRAQRAALADAHRAFTPRGTVHGSQGKRAFHRVEGGAAVQHNRAVQPAALLRGGDAGGAEMERFGRRHRKLGDAHARVIAVPRRRKGLAVAEQGQIAVDVNIAHPVGRRVDQRQRPGAETALAVGRRGVLRVVDHGLVEKRAVHRFRLISPHAIGNARNFGRGDIRIFIADKPLAAWRHQGGVAGGHVLHAQRPGHAGDRHHRPAVHINLAQAASQGVVRGEQDVVGGGKRAVAQDVDAAGGAVPGLRAAESAGDCQAGRRALRRG